MTKKEKLFYARYMKLSIEEGIEEGIAEARAEGVAANMEKTMKIIREAEMPEEFKSMLISRLNS